MRARISAAVVSTRVVDTDSALDWVQIIESAVAARIRIEEGSRLVQAGKRGLLGEGWDTGNQQGDVFDKSGSQVATKQSQPIDSLSKGKTL